MSIPVEQPPPRELLESRAGVFLHRYFAHPRLILFAFGTLMTAVTISTYKNEPNYLVFPNLYIAAGAAGAVASYWAMVVPGRWSLALAGAFVAGAISARGIGLILSAFAGPWRGDVSWTFIVGALAYLVMLTMLPPVWFRYLIPWAVDKVK